ncbi:MAG: MutS-related protein [Candidatus Syntrophosphaera sp.]
MSRQISKALGMDAIFDLIEAPGEFLQDVKSRELKRQTFKYSEARQIYARLEKLLALLRDEEDLLRLLRELFAHIPKPSFPAKQTSGPLALHEFFLLKEFLYHYQNLHGLVRKQGLKDHFPLPDLGDVFKLLDPEGNGLPSFRIYAAYSAKLGDLLDKRLQLASKLKHARARFLEEARRELQIPQLKEEFTFSRANSALAERILHSPFFVLSSENVANYSFILADDDACLDLKRQLSKVAEKLEKEEERVLKDLSRKVFKELPMLREARQILEQTGWLFVLADFALKHDCGIPRITRKPVIRVKQAVNLPLKLHLEEIGRRFQKVDYAFDQSVSLLTGPNMGGKTTILKTVGQLCCLARMGIPLPCKKAELPVFAHIWYNQDDLDSSADLSSFGKEVVSFTQALQEEGRTLFLLDEFARGTNPAEGELLASAVLRHLATTDHMCVAATHFTAPAMLDNLAQYSIAGLDASALKDHRPISPTQRLKVLSEAMDYSLKRLKKNQEPPLSAIRVARILGLPAPILKYTEKE